MSTKTGYGHEHDITRAALLREAAYTPTHCTRCGLLLTDLSAVDLDHNEDRTGYLGLAHSACNRAAGARKGNARSRTHGGTVSRSW